MSQSDQVLEYSPRSALSRRRRVYRWLIIISIIVIAWFGRGGPAWIIHDIKLRRLENQCESHSIPEGIVVYSSYNPGAIVRSPQAAALTGFERANYPYGMLFKGPTTRATLFTGELKASWGVTSYVQVEAVIDSSPDGGASVTILIDVFDPQMENKIVWNAGIYDSAFYKDKSWQNSPVVVMHSGVRDAHDPSRVTFTYRVLNHTYVQEVHLKGFGDVSSTATEVPAR